MLLRDLVAQYCHERDNSKAYDAHLDRHVRHFIEFCGTPCTVQDLTYELVNTWLDAILCVRSRSTAKSYRRTICTLWYYAAALDLTEMPIPRRIKRIKYVPEIPRAFSKEDILRLIEAANTLTGSYATGIKRSAFWRALIRGAYDLGARRGDLLRMPRSICDGKPFIFIECKTNQQQCRQLSPEGAALVQELAHYQLAYPWLRNMTTFRNTWCAIRRAAGMPCGQFKWLRRSHGTYAGTLGHRTQDVFHRHYRDPRLDMTPTSPGPLHATQAATCGQVFIFPGKAVFPEH